MKLMKSTIFKTLVVWSLLCFCTLGVQAQIVPIKRPQKTTSAPTKAKPKQQPNPKKSSQPQVFDSSPVVSETFTINGVSFKMIKVEGGTFTMGATKEQESEAYDEEKPAHDVTLSSYYIGETEVTQALWKSVMGNNPSKFKGDNRPVETVSWNDCQVFIYELNRMTGRNFRLPTEAEWEFAARGGNKSSGCKYSGSNNLNDVAWYEENSGSKSHPVMTKSPNELNIYDMTGNVSELCSDWFGRYSADAQTNPKGPNSGFSCVARGNSWFGYARRSRVSTRENLKPNYSTDTIGLRIAL